MDRVEQLLSQMTLREKLGQMSQMSGDFFAGIGAGAITGPMHSFKVEPEDVQMAGSVLGTTGAEQVIQIQEEYLQNSRLKIPLLFMADVIHGYRTIFPVPLALGCSWQPELVRECMAATAREAAAAGVQCNFSPMVDLVRDPRWGRVMESTGEDPWLNSQFAKAFVQGYQGESLGVEGTMAACVKHMAGYGAAEAGRDYNTCEISPYTLHDMYLPAYKAALDAGARLIMTSFNTLDGVPSTANKWLFRDLLRASWGFDGVSISDWGAVHELVAHGIAEDDKEAAAKAIGAGIDIEMMSFSYLNYGEKLVQEGVLSEELIDEAVLRILRLKEELGLFENPTRFANQQKQNQYMLCPEHRQLAREMAEASMVLLKNDRSLPLVKKQKLLVAGPYATAGHILGGWECDGRSEEAVTLQDGLQAHFNEWDIEFEQGCSLRGSEQDAIAVERAKVKMAAADTIILALGEHPDMSGEAGSRTQLTLPGNQHTLLDAAYASGKTVIVVLFTGRPLLLKDMLHKANAVLLAWFPGTEGGNAVARILSGAVNPSGKLTMSMPYTTGQCPVYYNCFSTGRPKPYEECTDRFYSMFLDAPNAPLLPFGYGLSYTSFGLGKIRQSAPVLEKGGKIHFEIDVTNTGNAAGCETVQLYITDVKGSRVRPVKELKGFEKVYLTPGDTKTVCFEVCEDMLRFTTLAGTFEAEAGEFGVMIGQSSAMGQYASFRLV